MLSFILLNRTSWVVQSAKGGRKLHLIIYPETRNLSKRQHGLSMMPLMRLKVSLMQTYKGDSVGHRKPLTIVTQVKGNGSISTDYLVFKNLNIGPLEKKKKKASLHDVPCPGWIVHILGQIPLGLGIAWRWEPKKRKHIPSAAHLGCGDAPWWAIRGLVRMKSGSLSHAGVPGFFRIKF